MVAVSIGERVTSSLLLLTTFDGAVCWMWNNFWRKTVVENCATKCSVHVGAWKTLISVRHILGARVLWILIAISICFDDIGFSKFLYNQRVFLAVNKPFMYFFLTVFFEYDGVRCRLKSSTDIHVLIPRCDNQSILNRPGKEYFTRVINKKIYLEMSDEFLFQCLYFYSLSILK